MQDKKQKLLNVLAQNIKNYRGNTSITRLSNEVDISKSIWATMEQGKRDIQFTTLWKVAEALDIKLSELISKTEYDLDEKFSFIDDF